MVTVERLLSPLPHHLEGPVKGRGQNEENSKGTEFVKVWIVSVKQYEMLR